MKSTEPLALDFKSATIYAVRLVLKSSNTKKLTDALNQRMHEAGSFFENEAVVIDASSIEDLIEWQPLLNAIRQHKLHPAGVVAHGANLKAAIQLGMAEINLPATAAVQATESAIKQTKSNPANESLTVKQAEPVPGNETMVINRPLRSGQRIYAREADLIVIGMVSQGAEVIADGNIHVYGPLRGKAMAGAHGNTKARIFTTQLDPELLAIAGIYRVIEARLEPDLHNQATVVQLEGDHLKIQPLNA